MFDYDQLEQLIAISECGTISAAAEKLHLSQPTLSRSMKKLESELGVSLFERKKNKAILNETGNLAVEHARMLVHSSNQMVQMLHIHEKSLNTVTVGGCSPGAVFELGPYLSLSYSDITYTSEIRPFDRLEEGLQKDDYQMILLPYPVERPDYICVPFSKEIMNFALPPNHKFSGRKSISMEEMNGEPILLLGDIGFWDLSVLEKMPDSERIVHEDAGMFTQLVERSDIPTFISNLGEKYYGTFSSRVTVPISDEDAHVKYYAVSKKTTLKRLKKLFGKLSR